MYKILIDNGMTIIFKDNGLDGLDENDMIDIIANDESTINIIESLKIREYYICIRNDYKKLNKEQAIFVYKEMDNLDKDIVSEDFKNIKIKDTGLFIMNKNNSIYKAIVKNNVDNLYDLFYKTSDIVNDLFDYENDKSEFIAVIKLLKYKYFNKELNFNLEDNVIEKNERRNFNEIIMKLQSIGVPEIAIYSYGYLAYDNPYDDIKIIDILNNIFKNNLLYYVNEKYRNVIYSVTRNRAELLLKYYNNKNEIHNKKELVKIR